MPTSPQRETAADTKPALTLAVHRMPSRNWDANVFKVRRLHSAFVHGLLSVFTYGFTFDWFLSVTIAAVLCHNWKLCTHS